MGAENCWAAGKQPVSSSTARTRKPAGAKVAATVGKNNCFAPDVAVVGARGELKSETEENIKRRVLLDVREISVFSVDILSTWITICTYIIE